MYTNLLKNKKAMYKIDGGGGKNRSLGNYRGCSLKFLLYEITIKILKAENFFRDNFYSNSTVPPPINFVPASYM